jgi:hypothetical protein
MCDFVADLLQAGIPRCTHGVLSCFTKKTGRRSARINEQRPRGVNLCRRCVKALT